MANSAVEEDWKIARRGMSLFLNNKPEEAEELFALHSESFHIKTARCFVVFMNALMTFEDENLLIAMETLKKTERECANDMGWLKSITSKVFRSEGLTTSGSAYARRLERQIVLADTKLCCAVLTLLQQQISGYVRGGWMMRKAWRVYQHTYLEILQLYRRTFRTNPSPFNGNCHSLLWGYRHILSSSCNSSPSGTTASTPTMSSPSSLRTSISMFFPPTGISSTAEQTAFIEPAEVARLMAAVSFGYGIFQLCVSHAPPSLLKLIHLLGFEGDREAGLTALMHARLSDDMRAPLATLSLLCYHTIVLPFCSPHNWTAYASVEDAKKLIAECQMEFRDGALFLFFIGRKERLQSNIEAALEAYDRAVEASAQREVKLLCLHEVGWCHLIRLNYSQAHDSFARLQRGSRWSENLYAYVAAACAGADSKFEDVLRIYREITATLGNGTGKPTQLDLFVLRRVPKLVDHNGQAHSDSYYKLLVFELLYLWNTLPSCSRESREDIIRECISNQGDEPMIGLGELIAGVAQPCRADRIVWYQKCLKRRGNPTTPSGDTLDQHVSAFALYEMGRILCATDRKEEGKTALMKAQNEYKDYDFEDRLNVRIHSALKALS